MQSQLLEPTATATAASASASNSWSAHARYLLDLAYRLLGSLGEAEEVVEEAYARLYRVDAEQLADARGWLCVTVTRLCLDQLHTARARRAAYVGPWLPEPLLGAADAADATTPITLDAGARLALLVALEQLSPAERAAFVLHDLLQLAFDDIARILERTPAACRQLACRARRHVQAEASPARDAADPETLRRVTAQFIQAANAGDLDALLAMLEPNVIGETDSGGVVNAPRRPVGGSQLVARTLLAFLQGYRATLRPARVNGEPGALVWQDDCLLGVVTLTVRAGRVSYIHAIANPRKLARLAATLGATLLVPPTG
jgi:RNA polymerase sigma-70 factor (ECF subfamily)